MQFTEEKYNVRQLQTVLNSDYVYSIIFSFYTKFLQKGYIYSPFPLPLKI